MNKRAKAALIYATLVASPQDLVYSVEAVELFRTHGLKQQDIEEGVAELVRQGYRINTIHIEKYGLKRVQMNFEEATL